MRSEKKAQNAGGWGVEGEGVAMGATTCAQLTVLIDARQLSAYTDLL